MKVVYNNRFNYDLGLLGRLHPFDGVKFRAIHSSLKNESSVEFISPMHAVSMDIVDEFLTSMMRKKVRDKVFIFRALEVPKIPLVSYKFLDKKILTPMRWGVAGTLLAAEQALAQGGVYWNLSGGYHHAMPQNMEGFCIYNDVGICVQQLVKKGLLSESDPILIIDTDAHHGNGNAYTFMDNPAVTLLDVYNAHIYPLTDFTRKRVDIPVPLAPNTDGKAYLAQYQNALAELTGEYKIAFVVAGTDVLSVDKLGGQCLSIEDVAQREHLTLLTLQTMNIPTVMLGGGGYSKDSAKAVAEAIKVCANAGF